MNGYGRITKFVAGEPVDRPPFMPLAIEWVARQEEMDYCDFVYQPHLSAEVYLSCAEKYHFDCILPDADFYKQMEDFGAQPVYQDSGFHAEPIQALAK